MGVAPLTFIDFILTETLDLTNVLAHEERYPELDLANISSPDYVFLSSEPYPFKEKHIAELRNFFPTSKIILVDGEYFSWYGSRLIDAPAYFKSLLTSLKAQ